MIFFFKLKKMAADHKTLYITSNNFLSNSRVVTIPPKQSHPLSKQSRPNLEMLHH